MKIEHANFGHLNSTEFVEEEEEGHKITQLEGASISSKWGLRDRRNKAAEARIGLRRLLGLSRQLLREEVRIERILRDRS